ncbi:Trk system potassium transporter TrkA [Treponema sp. OMZ 840]|uniref:Trk system potassium transporter TrkA n=1 Tax=Treponema sp. OMZ 840 TaxID=244313 RepID=UPI003D91A9B0
MKIIIIGAGFTGVQLARRLISEKNDVVIIESNEETVRHVSNRLDCMVIQATGNNLTVLEEAGIAKADALVAVTESDELNMITCSLVDSVYPDIIKIARVRNYDYYADVAGKKKDGKEKGARPLYGIDFMVHPDVEAAQAIVTAVEHGAVTEVVDFENCDFELVSLYIEEKSALAGKRIQNVRKLTSTGFLVGFIETEEKFFLPTGSTVLKAGMRIGLVLHKDSLPEFLHLCGSKIDVLKKIALVGAGRIGTGIAENLILQKKPLFPFGFFGKKNKASQDFVIIEADSKRAKEAAERFVSATVYNADVTDESFIEEEDLSVFDLVIAATSNHELNMITSAYMKTLGVSKAVCLVQSSNYATIARNIGIDVAVPIKDAVVDSILSHLRGKSVTGIHTLAEGELEIIEAVLPPSAPVLGKALKDIAVPGSFIILLIQEQGTKQFVIPYGNTVFEAGDRLVMLTYTKDIQRTMDLFGVGN